MKFSVNGDYVGQLCTVEGVSGEGVILGHHTIAGDGGPWYRFEVWFPTDNLPRQAYGDKVEIVRAATSGEWAYAETQQYMYNKRFRPARGNE